VRLPSRPERVHEGKVALFQGFRLEPLHLQMGVEDVAKEERPLTAHQRKNNDQKEQQRGSNVKKGKVKRSPFTSSGRRGLIRFV
jgi:hypothetical protein